MNDDKAKQALNEAKEVEKRVEAELRALNRVHRLHSREVGYGHYEDTPGINAEVDASVDTARKILGEVKRSALQEHFRKEHPEQLNYLNDTLKNIKDTKFVLPAAQEIIDQRQSVKESVQDLVTLSNPDVKRPTTEPASKSYFEISDPEVEVRYFDGGHEDKIFKTNLADDKAGRMIANEILEDIHEVEYPPEQISYLRQTNPVQANRADDYKDMANSVIRGAKDQAIGNIVKTLHEISMIKEMAGYVDGADTEEAVRALFSLPRKR